MEYIEKILPTLLVVSTGLVTWFLKDKSEKLKLQRELLIQEKRNNYESILEPLIRTLHGAKNQQELNKAIKQITSYEYKKQAFQLMLFGTDNVVQAYNNLFQFLYKHKEENDPRELLLALGKVVLEIRKDVGNEKTLLK